MDVKPAIIQEAEERLANIVQDIGVVNDLMVTDNLKYLTRVERERIFKRLLDNMGALEDTLKAMIKAGREVRRARLRDDEQLSRMVVAMTSHGLKVGAFEVAPDEPSTEVKALYAGDPTVPAPEELAVGLAQHRAALAALGSEGPLPDDSVPLG